MLFMKQSESTMSLECEHSSSEPYCGRLVGIHWTLSMTVFSEDHLLVANLRCRVFADICLVPLECVVCELCDNLPTFVFDITGDGLVAIWCDVWRPF